MPLLSRCKDPLNVAAGAIIAISLFALASWGLDIWHVQLLSTAHVPMAPSTALLFLLTGCCIITIRQYPGTFSKWIARSVAGFTAVTALLVITGHLAGLEIAVIRLLSPVASHLNGIPLGIMSPLTAVSFLLCALALFTGFPPDRYAAKRRQLSAFFSLLVILISLTVFLSYGVGAPLLYDDSSTIPMALITTICFLLTGGVLLAEAGRDTWPLSLFHTEPADLSESLPALPAQGPLAVFLLLTIAIGIMGVFYLKKQLTDSRQRAQADLEVIGKLKTDQITDWYRERLLDAKNILKNPLVQEQATHFLAGSPDPLVRRNLSLWLNELTHSGYSRAILYDRQGIPVLWSQNVIKPATATHRDFQRTIAARIITVTDLYQDKLLKDAISIDFWIPIAASNNGLSASGALLLKRNPNQFLYPLIQTWPTASLTAETLIVRRDGNNVLFLNRLRHQKGAELSLRLPLEPQKKVPATLAVLGTTGVIEGIDYRNVPVLAALYPIPDTPWFMVAKIDLSEVQEPVRRQAWITGGILLVLLFSTALWLSLQWQQRNNLWLRKQLAVEQAKTRAEEELSRLNAELEERVRLRTAQLDAANRELEAFSYSVSHDLRAPLRHLTGFVELLNKYAPQVADTKIKHYLDVITTSATQMSILVDDLLSFSRMGRVEMMHGQVRLDQMVPSILEKLESETAERKITWKIHNLPDVEGDGSMLRLVMMNLITNAIKYTGKTAESEIEIGCMHDNANEYVFFVRDNGAGFDMRYSDKLFHLFQRLHHSDEFEGNGVGLANAHRIILRHGGRIWAEGAVDQGATFYFSLPRGTADKDVKGGGP